jgi:pimeloyl-ACP methyl ester carboxylesterase
MGEDETGTLQALKTCYAAVVEPFVAQHHGRIFKTMGDGFLAEFGSVVEAVACAGAIQHEMATPPCHSSTVPMQLRIGVHVGDVVVESDGDVYGDGVNIAARLQSIAEAGGTRISRQVFDQVEGKLKLSYRCLGETKLKNLPRPIAVYAVDVPSYFGTHDTEKGLQQRIGYCRALDGTRLAHSTVGCGPVLVMAGHWMTHLELNWTYATINPLHALACEHTLIRYDPRGNGLSDWDVNEVSLQSWVDDLECVVKANRLNRFPLLGMSQGCAVAITYAVQHPERVSRLVLYGGFTKGFKKRNLNKEELDAMNAMRALIRVGWGADNAAFRQVFTTQFMPDATKEQADAFNELQRLSASAECAVRYWDAVSEIDVTHLLGKIEVPTLVMHVRGDARVPIEEGRKIASGIRGARFVAMPGRNHILLNGDPATERFLEETRLFLRE